MAAPHVAGAAALLAASGTYTPAQIRQLLYANGNFNWTDTAPDKIKEPLLDVGNAAVFKPRKLAGTSGGSGGSADTTPPSVSVLAPASGANLTGTVLVWIKAADNVTPAANLTVTWQLDSSAARSATYNAATGYFEANWDTTQSSSTAHLLSASATDAAKNTATSAATTVTVANAAPPTASMIGLANHLVLCTVSGTDLLIGLTMLNNLGAPVGGAVVSLNITRAQGGLWSGTGMTGSNGAVTFRLISAPGGVYATQFLAVSATLPWNKVQPTNVCSK